MNCYLKFLQNSLMKELWSPRITLLLIKNSDPAVQEINPFKFPLNVKGEGFPTLTVTLVCE